MDATNSALVKLPSGAKNLIIGGMNDNTVLGGVRATESAGFAAANVIGIGINGTDAIGELKKANSGFFGSMLPSPHIEGYKTAEMMYEWVTRAPSRQIHGHGRSDADHPRKLPGN